MVVLKYIATLWFVGYLPYAPGTFGSLVALILFILLKLPPLLHLSLLLLITPIGILSSHYAEKFFNKKDCGHIVIDEFCGYLLSVVLLPSSYAIAAFFLFRVFDILKPFPIRKVESIFTGGLAIMADDIVAALYTNLVLQVWKVSV